MSKTFKRINSVISIVEKHTVEQYYVLGVVLGN